jgi:predicted enzyme related to lactoylglutathione lyase
MINYIPVFTDDLKSTLDFYVQKLGFIYAGSISLFNGVDVKLVKLANQDVFCAIINKSAKNSSQFLLVFSSNDCLEEYHHLKSKGVKFCAEPYYTSSGLAVNFCDDDNNQFLLLEERCYTD